MLRCILVPDTYAGSFSLNPYVLPAYYTIAKSDGQQDFSSSFEGFIRLHHLPASFTSHRSIQASYQERQALVQASRAVSSLPVPQYAGSQKVSSIVSAACSSTSESLSSSHSVPSTSSDTGRS